MTMILPTSVGPLRRIVSASRSACGAPPVTVRLEPTERLERLRAAGAVVDDAHVALELAERAVGLPTEDAVDPAGVEPHVQQPLLQRGHVVADERVADGVLENPVAEAPASLVEQPPGLRADDAVDAGASLLLEVADGGVERVVERRRRVGREPGGLEQAQVRQAAPDLGHGGTGVAAAVDLLHES